MSRVLCQKHGTQGGPHCCKHVLHAVYGTGPAVAYREVTFDPTEDGTCPMPHLICGLCDQEYALIGVSQVSEDVWADNKRFPWVCPVCGVCLEEYKKTANQASHATSEPAPGAVSSSREG